jgi:hypothetical protein
MKITAAFASSPVIALAKYFFPIWRSLQKSRFGSVCVCEIGYARLASGPRIDLGKKVCSVVGLDGSGEVVLRRRAMRRTLIGLVAKLPRCTTGT